MLISVDWLPPYWCPSRRLLRSRLEGRSLVTRSKIAPKTGAASPPVARDPDQLWCTPRSWRESVRAQPGPCARSPRRTPPSPEQWLLFVIGAVLVAIPYFVRV